MNRILPAFLVFGAAGALSLSQAIEIVGTSTPQITIKAAVPAQYRTPIEGQINTLLAASFNQTLADARENLKGFDEPKKLARGFGNANAYSMNSATLQGFQNYDLFAVSTGILFGLQAPSTDLGYLEQVGDDISEKGDIYAGIGAGYTLLNVGVNAKFLMPGLYLNAKYGGMDLDFGDFGFKFSVMGVGANFRLLEPVSALGLVKWRGISVGSGFYYQKNEIDILIEGDSITTAIPFREQVINSAPPSDQAAYGSAMDELGFTPANPNARMALLPSFNMGLNVSTMTIPFDATTAVSVLWGLFNVNAGMGFDLNFGSSEVVLKGLASAETSTPDSTKVEFSDAGVTIDGGSDSGPSFARLRFMTGVGLGLGPVKVDVPLIFYPASGMAFGLTAAIVW